ncbi:MAG TPA: DUF3604 domain-containing protein [Chloroflexota bacterium]|nr:DUF3604 domain-containing protein [Chloroflexota bacterium]
MGDLATERVTVTPERGRRGEWGTWTVRFHVGQPGLAAGGAIRVALPDRWHQWHRNSARRVQATAPREPFYVSARSSRSGVGLRCEVEEQEPERPFGESHGNDQFAKQPRRDITGRTSRYAWVVRVTVAEGSLTAGDHVDVLFGDRSQGGRGFTPPLWVGSPERVRAAVDRVGRGEFVPLPETSLPWLHTDPGVAVELAVILPSDTVAGEPAEALLVALDAEQNPVWHPELRVTLSVLQGEVDFPRGVEAALSDQASWGSVRLPFMPRAAGRLRLRGQSADGRLYTVSNPSRCHATAPAQRVYWGDLHSHSHYSWDGTGTGDDHFRYARDVAGLEVYGNADHGESLSKEDWEAIIAYNARYYEPGRFVTLVGYENSQPAPYQHHNVFYRGVSGPLVHARQATLPEFWAQSRPGEVLTIPHHPAGFGTPGRGVRTDWTIRDDRFRKAVEIYSSHGLSEAYAPDHPLSLDVVDFTFQGPADAGSYVQDGWLTGQRMGTIASSDNHWSQPGKEGFGIMAAAAPALTREAVFDAIAARRTYGTTGSRILLDFEVAGMPMGGECRLPREATVPVRAEIAGTGPLRLVEVLRGDLEAGEWRVVHRRWFGGASAPLEAVLDWTDESPPARALYYLRVRQRDLVHGRVAMAWSSPVWVELTSATGAGVSSGES